MFGKQSKEELRRQLEAQCEHAMFLDSGVKTLYAGEPLPSKSPYRPRKKSADAFAQEIAKLQAAKESQLEVSQPQETSGSDVDVQSLEQEVADFLRNRRAK